MADVAPGIVLYASFPASYEDEDVFLHSVEVAAADPYLEVIELFTFFRSAAARVRDILRGSGKRIFLSAGPETVRSPDGVCAIDARARARALDAACRMLEQARELGAENLMLVSGPDPGPDDRAAAREALADSLATLCGLAAAPSPPVGISIETFARRRPPRQLIGPTREAVDLLDRVASGHANFGLTVDLSHLVQLGEDPERSLRALAGRVRHVHLSTCITRKGHELFGDRHPSFAHPDVALRLDEASAAVRLAVRELGDVDPSARPVVSVEIRPRAGEDPRAVYEIARSELRHAIAHAVAAS